MTMPIYVAYQRKTYWIRYDKAVFVAAGCDVKLVTDKKLADAVRAKAHSLLCGRNPR